jgi:hypothetical protein
VVSVATCRPAMMLKIVFLPVLRHNFFKKTKIFKTKLLKIPIYDKYLSKHPKHAIVVRSKAFTQRIFSVIQKCTLKDIYLIELSAFPIQVVVRKQATNQTTDLNYESWQFFFKNHL